MTANKLVNRLNNRFPFSSGYEAFVANNNRVSFVDPMSDYYPKYFDVLQEAGGFIVKWTEGKREKRKSFNDFTQLCEYIEKRIDADN